MTLDDKKAVSYESDHNSYWCYVTCVQRNFHVKEFFRICENMTMM